MVRMAVREPSGLAEAVSGTPHIILPLPEGATLPALSHEASVRAAGCVIERTIRVCEAPVEGKFISVRPTSSSVGPSSL